MSLYECQRGHTFEWEPTEDDPGCAADLPWRLAGPEVCRHTFWGTERWCMGGGGETTGWLRCGSKVKQLNEKWPWEEQ